MKNNLIALSIFCLALSFVMGSWLIAKGLNEIAIRVKEVYLTTETTNETTQPQMFKKSGLAIYLGLSEDEVEKLGPVPYGNNGITSELPYLQIGSTVYYPKEAIDKWLQNDMKITITR